MSDSSGRPASKSQSPRGEDEPIPLPQRLADRPFVLLFACLAVMFLFFTAWGIYEMFTLPQAPLP